MGAYLLYERFYCYAYKTICELIFNGFKSKIWG